MIGPTYPAIERPHWNTGGVSRDVHVAIDRVGEEIVRFYIIYDNWVVYMHECPRGELAQAIRDDGGEPPEELLGWRDRPPLL